MLLAVRRASASATSSRRCAGRRIANDAAGRVSAGSTRWCSAGSPATTSCPVRIGELLRAGWLSRDAPMPGGRALGTRRARSRMRRRDARAVPRHRHPGGADARLAQADRDRRRCSRSWSSRQRSSSRAGTRATANATVETRGRVRRIVRDTIDMLGEPIGRRRAAVWLGLSIVDLDARHGRGVPRRAIGRDRPRAARRGLRRVRARPRRRDPVVARATSARTSGSASRRSACSTSR